MQKQRHFIKARRFSQYRPILHQDTFLCQISNEHSAFKYCFARFRSNLEDIRKVKTGILKRGKALQSNLSESNGYRKSVKIKNQKGGRSSALSQTRSSRFTHPCKKNRQCAIGVKSVIHTLNRISKRVRAQSEKLVLNKDFNGAKRDYRP